jgi:hypothetical protein
MKTRTSALFLAFPIALALGAGAAQAQLKAPANTQPKEGLGSGLGSGVSSPSAPASPAPAPGAAPAAATAAPATQKIQTADEVVQDIANCILGALPANWKLAQVEVREIGRTDKQREFEAFYTYQDSAGKAATFVPCDPREPALNVYKLNGALEPAKRNWKRATLVMSKEGKFEVQYDYTEQDAGKDAKPAAAADAKKSAKKDAKKKPAAGG